MIVIIVSVAVGKSYRIPSTVGNRGRSLIRKTILPWSTRSLYIIWTKFGNKGRKNCTTYKHGDKYYG